MVLGGEVLVFLQRVGRRSAVKPHGGMGLGGQGVCPLSTARGAPVPRLFHPFISRENFRFKSKTIKFNNYNTI